MDRFSFSVCAPTPGNLQPHLRLPKPVTTNYLSPEERAKRRRSDAKASYLLDVPIIRADAGAPDYPSIQRDGKAEEIHGLKRGLRRGLKCILKPVRRSRKDIPRRAVLPSVFDVGHRNYQRAHPSRTLRRARSDISLLRRPLQSSSAVQQDGTLEEGRKEVEEGREVGEKEQGAEAASLDADWRSLFARYGSEGFEVTADRATTPLSSSGSEEQSTLVSPRLSEDAQNGEHSSSRYAEPQTCALCCPLDTFRGQAGPYRGGDDTGGEEQSVRWVRES